MLDGTEYFECQCGSDEHALRFTLDLDPDDPGIYTSVYLGTHRGFWARLWYGLRYAFGYQSRYGAFHCWIMQSEDAIRLREMADRLASNSGYRSVTRLSPHVPEVR